MMAPTILAFDCSGGACSAALWSAGALRAQKFAPVARGHAEILMPQIRDVMAEARTRFEDLSAIAVTTGPGSFTGIRIGLAAARGLALATGLPLRAATAFEAYWAAYRQHQDDRDRRALLVAIDSRRGPVFVQSFEPDGKASSAPVARDPSEIEAGLDERAWWLIGDGAALIPPATRSDIAEFAGFGLVRADALALFAAERPELAERRPVPLYLCAPDVTVRSPALG